MRTVAHFVEDPRVCQYLGDRMARLEYRVVRGITLEAHDALIVRGWRRFGPVYFRPACEGCVQCVSVRVPVASFAPTESQKRARRRAQRFRAVLGPPRLDTERLELFARWHAAREEARGWPSAPMDADEYANQFAYPHPAARELALYDGSGRLVLVGLCDVSPSAWSAVYCFYDPGIARLSPGVANVMLCLELARQHGIPHVYLGFLVAGCASMRYKAQFQPQQHLAAPCDADAAPVWR